LTFPANDSSFDHLLFRNRQQVILPG